MSDIGPHECGRCDVIDGGLVVWVVGLIRDFLATEALTADLVTASQALGDVADETALGVLIAAAAGRGAVHMLRDR